MWRSRGSTRTCRTFGRRERPEVVAAFRTGDWARARRLLAGAPERFRAAVDVSIRQEAHALRNEIVDGLTRQAPGGTPLKPLARLTLAARQLGGIGGTKALIARGDLRNAISVLVVGGVVSVGVPRSARASDGGSLVDLAQLHEFGGPPVLIPITPKMRAFLFALFRQAGMAPARRGGRGGPGVVVVQTPARPFLRPAFERFRQGAARRLLTRLAAQLGFGGAG